MGADLTADEQFFYDNAGYASPVGEDPQPHRIQGARQLAAAEQWVKDGPFFVAVEADDQPWDGDVPYDGPLWVVYLCSVRDTSDPLILGSLCGVGCEAGDPYLRVVGAELALEHLAGEG